MLLLLLLLLAVGGWPISQPQRAEAFSRPSAQLVSTQRCVCVYRHKAEVSAYAYACVVSSLCPVCFSLTGHTAAPGPQHWPSRLTRLNNITQHVDWFPLQIPDWRVVYCTDLLHVFPTRNVFNFLLVSPFLIAAYLSKTWCSIFVLKLLLNFNQSISLFL